MKEELFVLESFQRNFLEKNVVPIVIYGVGKYTKKIVDKFNEAEIVGLMDEVRTGENIFGKKVISIEEVKELGVKNILVLARSSNIEIIYRRIQKYTMENDITVYDINGKVLSKMEKSSYKLPSYYKNMSIEKLERYVKNVDVVSFDIFDTLLIRDVLFPTDIFEYLCCDGYSPGEIKKYRIKAERELELKTNPTIQEIYKRMESEYGFTREQCYKLMLQEIKLEKEHIYPRKTMVALLKKIQDEKTVFLTSDMYLPRDILVPILKENGINIRESNILISCEEQYNKYNGLYKKLRKLSKEKKILHIGDNYDSDVLAAQKSNIDSTFYIRNVYGMLEDSRLKSLLYFQDDLSHRRAISKFINYYFEDPFLFSYTKGKVIINSEFHFGYYFVAPIVVCYLKWLLEILDEMNIDNILLGARDGYIIERLLGILQDNNIKVPCHQYIYTSRAVCTVAGIRDEKELLHVASLGYSGTVEQMLKTRFRLLDEEIFPRKNETDENYILKHKDVIFRKSARVRERYLKYLKNNLKKETEYAFFDFVAEGNCQRGLESILQKKLRGIYFTKIPSSDNEKLSIITLYKNSDNVYEKQNDLAKNYLWLEKIFTSFESTVVDFDEKGNPIFQEETRTKEQLIMLKEIHKGIEVYLKEEIDRGWDNSFNFDISDFFLKLVSKDFVTENNIFFSQNLMEDEFCNRNFIIDLY